jgi:hypothetical protein
MNPTASNGWSADTCADYIYYLAKMILEDRCANARRRRLIRHGPK